MHNRWMSGVLQTFSVLSFGTDAKPNWLRPSLASWLWEVNGRIIKTMPSEIWSNKIGQATFCLRSKPLMGGSRSALALSRARLVTDAASARRMSELFASLLWHIMCPGVASVATQLVLLLHGFVVAGVLCKQMSNVPYRSRIWSGKTSRSCWDLWSKIEAIPFWTLHVGYEFSPELQMSG